MTTVQVQNLISMLEVNNKEMLEKLAENYYYQFIWLAEDLWITQFMLKDLSKMMQGIERGTYSIEQHIAKLNERIHEWTIENSTNPL